jgi:glycosyltransferase involved in cell wall biosynthesis
MPVYNAERYLRESIDSVLGQSFEDWELILVDDKSRDRSPEIEAEYAARDRRIRAIKLDTNQGPIRARNIGIARAQGKYYAVQDSDDVSLPERLQLQVDFLQANPAIAIVGAASLIMDENGKVYASRTYPADPEAVKRRAILANPFAHSATMVRIEVLRQIGGYPVLPYEASDDYCLWLRLLSQYRGSNLPEFLLKYRLFASQYKNSIRQKLRNTVCAQRPWLLHPEYRSALGVLNYALEHALILLPQPLVLSLFKLKAYRGHQQ